MCTFNIINGGIGAKASMFRKITAFFDETCIQYMEPFVGGGGIFFGMYNKKYELEWINDANSELAFLYKAFASEKHGDSVVNELMKVEKSNNKIIAQAQFNEALEKMRMISNDLFKDIDKMETADVIDVCRYIYILYTQSFNSNAKTYSSQKSEKKYERHSKRNLQNAYERIKKKGLIITNYNALKLIPKFKNRPDIQMYLDPPYVGLYRKERKLYAKEMADLISHIELAELINDAKCAIVLSGYRNPDNTMPTIYDALLGKDWHCYKIKTAPNNCEVIKKGVKRKYVDEYIWTNRVPENAKFHVSMTDYKENLTIDDYWQKVAKSCKEGRNHDKDSKEYRLTYQQLYGKELY